ncbi:MAG: DUF5005 domain-containing protein, partial [Bacteroidia bacterium]|nr:DUF5005 domain-containing protein [Bacteroidia bacterium]
MFGDSFIGTALPDSSIAPGAHMIRNCAILQQEDSLQSIFNGTFEDPSDFIATPDPDSSWFWPEHGMVENDTLKIFMSEFITNNGAPGWNFEFRDTYLVFLSYPGLELLGMEVLPYHEINEVMYGNQLLIEGNYTYIYGRRDGPNNVANAHIARTTTDNLNGSWEFFDGNGWTTDASASYWITYQAVSQQYAAFKHQAKYVLLTQQIWLGTKIYTFTADAPEGPWDNFTEIYSTPLPFPDMFTYNAWAHPQFNEQDELLVSYNSNGDFWQIFNNVELYRPTFIRVPFELIDSTFILSNTSHQDPVKKEEMVLYQNYPNPVLDKTTIALSLKKEMFVNLELY